MNTHQATDDRRVRRLIERGRDLGRTLKDQLPRSSHEAHTKDTDPVLSPPLVTLFVSASNRQESEAAFEALAASRTAFRVEQSATETVSASFVGKLHHGIEAINALSDGLISVARILLDTRGDEAFAAELDRRYDPDMKERAERELQNYLDCARADLHHVLDCGEAATDSRKS